MRCQWESFIKILPQWLQEPVDKLGKKSLAELRLRVGLPPQLVLLNRSLWLDRNITKEDIHFCINTASQYSPWAGKTAAHGYITAPGGHRIGICGEAIISEGRCTGFRHVTSVCIRIARDIPDLARRIGNVPGSILIIGPPGSGKTTLLRDLIRQKSNNHHGCIAVLDERGEIFPSSQGRLCFETGPKTDILTGISKIQGMDILIRCMGPSIIAVDEITAAEDCSALIHACGCGVEIIATAHAYDRSDLCRRQIYRPLIENKLFQNLVIIQQDKSWQLERMES